MCGQIKPFYVYFSSSKIDIQNLKATNGLALEDILREVHLMVMRIEFTPVVLSTLLIKLADIERRLASGCSERPQVAAFVAAFHIARGMVST